MKDTRIVREFILVSIFLYIQSEKWLYEYVQSQVGDQLLLDPSAREEQRQQGQLMLSLAPKLGQITQISCKGLWRESLLKDAIEIAKDGCEQMDEAVRDVLLSTR